MARTKRISGNYTIDPTGTFSVLANTTITGDLTVTGTQTTIVQIKTQAGKKDSRQKVMNTVPPDDIEIR